MDYLEAPASNLMSAFTTGLIASTSLYAADKSVTAEIKKEIRPGGLTYAVSVNEQIDPTAGMKQAFIDYGIEDLKKAMEGLKIWNDLS